MRNIENREMPLAGLVLGQSPKKIVLQNLLPHFGFRVASRLPEEKNIPFTETPEVVLIDGFAEVMPQLVGVPIIAAFEHHDIRALALFLEDAVVDDVVNLQMDPEEIADKMHAAVAWRRERKNNPRE